MIGIGMGMARMSRHLRVVMATTLLRKLTPGVIAEAGNQPHFDRGGLRRLQQIICQEQWAC